MGYPESPRSDPVPITDGTSSGDQGLVKQPSVTAVLAGKETVSDPVAKKPLYAQG